MINKTEETKSVEHLANTHSLARNDDEVKSGLSKMVSIGVSCSDNDEMAGGSLAGAMEPRDIDRK